MKKLLKALSLILVFSTVLTFFGCYGENEPESQNPSGDSNNPKQAEISAEDVRPVLDGYFNIEGVKPNNLLPVKFDKNTAFIDYSVGNGENRKDFINHSACDFETGEVTTIGKTEHTTASSSKDVIMDGVLYSWINVLTEEGQEINKLVKCDSNKKEYKDIEGKALSRRLLALDKVNENEFISSVRYGKAGKTTTVIDIYNVKTNEKRNLLTLNFEDDADKPNSTGMTLETVCVADGKIYGIGRERANDEYTCYLYIFGLDGKLQKKIAAPDVMEGIGFTTALHLYVVGDYFALANYNVQWSLYKIENDEISCVMPCGDDYRFALGMENLNDSSKSLYFYYYPISDFENNKTSYFYAFDTRNGQTTKINAPIDAEHPTMNYLATDENGNLIMCLDKDFAKFQTKYYYISRETIENAIKG